MSTLERWWRRCFEDIGGSEPPDCVWEELQARYSEPHRAYHTLQHLEECFGWFEQVRALARQPGDIAFALFYHDAIYDTHASDNEAQSAKLAADVLSEYVRGDADAARVSSLIMATTHDAQLKDADACLLVDIDLSILGAEPARFDEYEQQIRSNMNGCRPSNFVPAAARYCGRCRRGRRSTPWRFSGTGWRRRRGKIWRDRSRLFQTPRPCISQAS